MNRRIVFSLSAAALLIGIIAWTWLYSFSLIPQIFRMNAQLKAEGYYMGELEFKLLGLVYCLDKGQYVTAIKKLNQLHRQMKTRNGLVKIPKFKNDGEKLDFFLSLQNPRTGAFMDDSYPYFTYIAPTLNMIDVIEDLSGTAGKPVRLKYPLKFLDQINTTEKLVPYLDDLSTISSWWVKLKAPYIAGISELAYYDIIERNGLYAFSDKWKEGLLSWLYKNQDAGTGYWGVKVRSGRNNKQVEDVGSTYHIIRLFMDREGNEINPKYPLRYKEEIFQTTLRNMSQPMPKDSDLAEQHDWSMSASRGMDIIGSLWKCISDQHREDSKAAMKQLVANRFKEFYRKKEGGFSLYSESEHADMDGTGEGMYLLAKIGALPGKRRELLWGRDLQNVRDFGCKPFSVKESDLTLAGSHDVNSICIYSAQSNGELMDKDIKLIYYPKEPVVLDATEVRHNVAKFLRNTQQEYGNWVSREMVTEVTQLSDLGKMPEIIVGKLRNDRLSSLFASNKKVIAVGFDELQVPKYKATYVISE